MDRVAVSSNSEMWQLLWLARAQEETSTGAVIDPTFVEVVAPEDCSLQIRCASGHEHPRNCTGVPLQGLRVWTDKNRAISFCDICSCSHDVSPLHWCCRAVV